MLIFIKLLKTTLHITFVIVFIFFSTLEAKNFDKAENISDYFSGILLLSQNKYSESNTYLKKLDGLENIHKDYSSKYLYSLVNSGNLNRAFQYSKKLERQRKDSFLSDLVTGIYLFKNSQFEPSQKYLLKAKNRRSNSIIENYIANSLFIWASLKIKSFEDVKKSLSQQDNRFDNFKKIQIIFLNCFYKNKNTEILFEQLILNDKVDFSRYNYFYAN